jgi:hypothetical protein
MSFGREEFHSLGGISLKSRSIPDSLMSDVLDFRGEGGFGVMKRILNSFALALTLSLSLVFSAPTALAARPVTERNPSSAVVKVAAAPHAVSPDCQCNPCLGGARPIQSVVMGGDIVYIQLTAGATGMQGACAYAYTEWLWTKYGSNISAWFKIRHWDNVNGNCGTFNGTDQSNGYVSGPSIHFTGQTHWYGACPKAADNYGTIITVSMTTYTICYYCGGYENF